MSKFNELVKSFAKSREYIRDFFVYGFKTRDDFNDKSARTYDNERRRIESWLAGFVRHDYTDKGKKLFLAIDSNMLNTNPLYRVWKTKSFTDNDLLLHFFILDCLCNLASCTADLITDTLVEKYGMLFDVQTVRRKCNDYVNEGLLTKTKNGREVLYKIRPDFTYIVNKYNGISNAISYYQLAAPLGIVGSTLMDTFGISNNLFRVKHGFCVHTLEDEVLLDILTAIKNKMAITIICKRNSMNCIPIQIFVSTRSGRRFLCVYLKRPKRFNCVRIDLIKKIILQEHVKDYGNLKSKLEQNHKLIWGVSFQNTENIHRQWIKMTLIIHEPSENYILIRLQREGRGGTITKIATDTYTYEKEVFDANEMMPWIRTFIGRIAEFTSSSKHLEQLFKQDLQAMYKIYGIEPDNISAADGN